jgi:hypothetical protein
MALVRFRRTRRDVFQTEIVTLVRVRAPGRPYAVQVTNPDNEFVALCDLDGRQYAASEWQAVSASDCSVAIYRRFVQDWLPHDTYEWQPV